MTCPDCGNMIAYNSYFSAFYCPRCGGIFKKVKPMTNADRIRAMSDDELAEFLIDLADDGNLKIREWLQQPTKRDELIRVLHYDREQYQKGFDDAREDAVVVTRCKDCEHLVNATVNGNGFLICDISDMEIAPDDFCSYGERREE